MFKILNELVEIPFNDRLIPADRRTRGGHNQAYKHIRANTTLGQNSFWHRTIPDWNSLRQLPQDRKLWQHSRVSWSTRSASLFPPSSLILHNGGLLEYSLKVKVKALDQHRNNIGSCPRLCRENCRHLDTRVSSVSGWNRLHRALSCHCLEHLSITMLKHYTIIKL